MSVASTSLSQAVIALLDAERAASIASRCDAKGASVRDVPGSGFGDLSALPATLSASGVGGPGDPLADARGAPLLAAPSEVFSANDMVDLLRALRSKTADVQISTAQQGLESARIKAERNTDMQLAKINDWIEKCKEAEAKGTLGKVCEWIGRISAAAFALVTVVVAGAATIATGGAAAPLLVFAVVGAVAASMSLANAISQEFDGPEISIRSLIQNSVGKFLTQVCGVDEKVASHVCDIIGGVVAVGFPLAIAIEPALLGNVVQTIAVMAGLDENTAAYIGMACTLVASIAVGITLAVLTAGASFASTATVVSEVAIGSIRALNSVIIGASAAVSGGTGIAAGAFAIRKAHFEDQAQHAVADKEDLQAAMRLLQMQMEDNREEFEKVIQQIEESTQTVSKMIAAHSASITQVAMNMGGRSTV